MIAHSRTELIDAAEFAWLADYYPRILPAGWVEAERRIDGRLYKRPMGVAGVWSVILSGDVELDGRRWVHLSTAMSHRTPSWPEVVDARDMFLGRDRKCIQVLAPIAEHVNINAHCLHVWHCVDGDPLPDFTRGGGTL